MAQRSPQLDAVLDRLEGTVAVLRFPDGQLLRVPAAALPEATPGTTVRLGALLPEAERAALARTVLNQLLAEQ